MKILLLLFIFNFIHCSTEIEIKQNSTSNINVKSKTPIILSIAKVEDLRKFDSEELIGFFFIPFYFWETENTKKLAFDSFFNTDFFQKDFRLKIKNKLNLENYFDEVYLSNNEDWKEADYLIQVKIIKTDFKRTTTLYGLSIFGVYLSILGTPILFDKLETEFEFNLVDIKKDKIILTKKYIGEIKRTINIYMGFKKSGMIKIDFIEKHIELFSKDCIKYFESISKR